MVLVYAGLLCSGWPGVCLVCCGVAVVDFCLVSAAVMYVASVVLVSSLVLLSSSLLVCPLLRRNKDLAHVFLARRNVSAGIFGGVAVVASTSAGIVLRKWFYQ